MRGREGPPRILPLGQTSHLLRPRPLLLEPSFPALKLCMLLPTQNPSNRTLRMRTISFPELLSALHTRLTYIPSCADEPTEAQESAVSGKARLRPECSTESPFYQPRPLQLLAPPACPWLFRQQQEPTPTPELSPNLPGTPDPTPSKPRSPDHHHPRPTNNSRGRRVACSLALTYFVFRS